MINITASLGVDLNNILASHLPDREETAPVSLLSLIPPRYAFLFIFLAALSDCTAFTDLPPRRPDAGEDGDVECVVGERLENYSGPPGTQGVGLCQPEIVEVTRCDPREETVIQEEILPQEEITGNGIDENCDGTAVPCLPPIIDSTETIGMVIGHQEGSDCFGTDNICDGDTVYFSFSTNAVTEANEVPEAMSFYFIVSRLGETETIRPRLAGDNYDATTMLFTTGAYPYIVSVEAESYVCGLSTVGAQQLELYVDPFCVEGARHEQYSGPTGTMNVGICQPYVEECQDRGDGIQYYQIQAEILPTSETCNNGVDEDCDGYDTGEIAFPLYHVDFGNRNLVSIPFIDAEADGLLLETTVDLGNAIADTFEPDDGDSIGISVWDQETQTRRRTSGDYYSGAFLWDSPERLTLGHVYEVSLFRNLRAPGTVFSTSLTITGDIPAAGSIRQPLYHIDDGNLNWISIPWYREDLATTVDLCNSIASAFSWPMEGDTVTTSVWNPVDQTGRWTTGDFSDGIFNWDSEEGYPVEQGRPYTVSVYRASRLPGEAFTINWF